MYVFNMHFKLQSTSYIVVNRFFDPYSDMLLDRSFQFLQSLFFSFRINSIANIFNSDLLTKVYWWLVSMLWIYFSWQSSFICIHELVDLSSGDFILKCYTSLEEKKAIKHISCEEYVTDMRFLRRLILLQLVVHSRFPLHLLFSFFNDFKIFK